MCTVTFLPRPTGYYLAMNRDEKRVRPKGLAPKQRIVAGHKVLYPSEPGGGTWIALNDAGGSLALVNWHSVTARAKRHAVSRGGVVGTVCSASNQHLMEVGRAKLPLRRINPFRLIGVFPATRQVAEWRWGLKRLTRKSHRWRARQWISSGFDEPAAQRVRIRTFRLAQRQKSAGSLALAAALAPLALTAEGPVFQLHASQRCRHGELH